MATEIDYLAEIPLVLAAAMGKELSAPHCQALATLRSQLASVTAERDAQKWWADEGLKHEAELKEELKQASARLQEGQQQAPRAAYKVISLGELPAEDEVVLLYKSPLANMWPVRGQLKSEATDPYWQVDGLAYVLENYHGWAYPHIAPAPACPATGCATCPVETCGPAVASGAGEQEMIGRYETSGLPVYEGDDYVTDVKGCYLTRAEANELLTEEASKLGAPLGRESESGKEGQGE